MNQLLFIKKLKKAIPIFVVLLAFVLFNGCNNSSTDSTEVKDSTSNTMSDPSTMPTDSLPKFDSLQDRTDTSRSDQTAPPK